MQRLAVKRASRNINFATCILLLHHRHLPINCGYSFDRPGLKLGADDNRTLAIAYQMWYGTDVPFIAPAVWLTLARKTYNITYICIYVL